MNIIEEHIFLDINHSNKYEAIKHIIDNSKISDEKKDKIFKEIKEREELQSTSVGNRVGVAHARTEEINELVVLLGVSREGLDYEAHDGEDVNLIFVVVTPKSQGKDYLRVLSKISKICRNSREELDNILKLDNKSELLSSLGLH